MVPPGCSPAQSRATPGALDARRRAHRMSVWHPGGSYISVPAMVSTFQSLTEWTWHQGMHAHLDELWPVPIHTVGIWRGGRLRVIPPPRQCLDHIGTGGCQHPRNVAGLILVWSCRTLYEFMWWLYKLDSHEYIGSGYRISLQGSRVGSSAARITVIPSHQYISCSAVIVSPCRETDWDFMGVFESQCGKVSSVRVAFSISAAEVNFFFLGLLMLHDPRNDHRTGEMTADATKIKSDIWPEAGTSITNAYSANGSRRRE
ncbi:hypothetical protein V8E53_010178 [Lactarius tabidus]